MCQECVTGAEDVQQKNKKREEHEAQLEGQVHGRASPATCSRCGNGANFALVYKVCWLGIGEKVRQASQGRQQTWRLKVSLSGQKVGAEMSSWKKHGMWQERGCVCAREASSDHCERISESL